MIINLPEEAQISDLKSLWREAFGDTEEFLDAFYRTAFRKDRCRIVMTDGNLAAALYWFNCYYFDKHIAYVYAVATAKAYRRQGICHGLMKDAHRHLVKLDYDGAVLVPGSKELFRLYEGMGYQICSTVREFSCTAAANEIPIRHIDKEEYAGLRRKFLPSGGIVQEKENLDFLQTQVRFYQGPGFLLAAGKEGEILHGTELLGDETKAPEIVKALGCMRGEFRVPGEDKPFAMYYPLKDGAIPFPVYFGLAFD